MTEGEPKVRLSVVIPSHKRDEDLRDCVASIRDNSTNYCEVIVLTPEAGARMQETCNRYHVVLREDGSRAGGSRVKSLWAIINQGIELATSDFVCWLNDDCTVNSGWDSAALSYFAPEIGLVVLRTKGINKSPKYGIRLGHYGVPVANYAVLRKNSRVRFDTRFNWFYGDADISLQMARDTPFKIAVTTENLVIHRHRVDSVRLENENDPRAEQDRRAFDRKWRFFKEAGDRVVAMNSFEAAWTVARDALRVPYDWIRNHRG